MRDAVDQLRDRRHDQLRSRRLEAELSSSSSSFASSLNILAFGTSDTWGSGLDDRETQHTYPQLLSELQVLSDPTDVVAGGIVDNLAIRATGPAYPALCLQSMLEQQYEQRIKKSHSTAVQQVSNHPPDTSSSMMVVPESPEHSTTTTTTTNYHVIVIELMLRSDEGLDVLVGRLRQRFPEAIIILLDIWYPRMVRVHGTNHHHRPRHQRRHAHNSNGPLSSIRQDGEAREADSSISLVAYSRLVSMREGLASKDFQQHLLDTAKSQQQHANISFSLNARADLQSIQQQVARRYQCYTWTLPYPPSNETIPLHLVQLAKIWSPDAKHLSAVGHAYVARGIARLLKSIPNPWTTTTTTTTMTRSASNIPTVARMPLMNPWEYHDSCANWLLDPSNMPHPVVQTSTDNINDVGAQLIEFDTSQHKFALQPNPTLGVTAINNNAMSIPMRNPFETPVRLYLSYMATGDVRYPNAEVSILQGDIITSQQQEEEEDARSSNVRLLVPRTPQHAKVHISITTFAGELAPGWNTVVVRPIPPTTVAAVGDQQQQQQQQQQQLWPFRITASSMSQVPSIIFDHQTEMGLFNVAAAAEQQQQQDQ